ncbi:ABC transporter ATP-binding protein [Roseofilum sp. BLCC_M154]|uniref:ABC transporter ATP-binding protein n=1 Tax=Roseofilum acuticapitatum BLCC-M154 TaxID=3022444 RepID=A0ABT7ANW9_9CYAN|nr:ABC transporter ATP-binding protein [Roseofilum acuticapitatum]MDJ1168603.1 ABC transporter ATP-binding protein [Roseofilum acuticapitatum BLCC-M154]
MTSSPSSVENSRGKQNDWQLLMRLVPYARRHGKLLAVSLTLLLPLSLASAIQPLIVGQAVSKLKSEPTWDILDSLSVSASINLLAALLLFTIVFRLLFAGVQGFMIQKVGQQLTADIRNDLFDHVTALAVKFFDRTPVGSLITRLTNDVEALGEVFSTGAIGIINDIVSIVVIGVVMFRQQWQLALLLIALLIPVTLLIIYFQQQYRAANYLAREELSKLNAQFQENIIGIDVVQLFRRERFNQELFRKNNQRFIEAIDKTIFYDSGVSATLEWVALVAVAGVLGLGGMLILQDKLTFGTLSEFILFAPRFFDPLRRFAEKFTMFQSGFTAIERINELMSQPIDIRDPEAEKRQNLHTEISENKLGEIRFEDVWFAYKNDEFVIKNLDFTIRPGEKIALVGPTGAGKSSVIRLLCRLYEPTYGRILVDGVDIRYLPQQELRRHIGVILQDGFLFSGDVKSNISLGESYPLEKIEEAAKLTNINRFIEELPQGYDTQLRERGTNLSSGQKQLLAFARVAIRNPNILVLDEATSSLDVGTEALVQEALDQLLIHRTAIIIAHRLSTIRNVDRIFVLKQGELFETGTHESLLAQKGLYASLYQLQMLGT